MKIKLILLIVITIILKVQVISGEEYSDFSYNDIKVQNGSLVESDTKKIDDRVK